MQSKKNSGNAIDESQHTLFEYAQQRIRDKKRCYNHAILFLIGSVFVFITNKVMHYGPDSDWFVWIVLLWSILLAYHWVQVFIMNRFLGPNWVRIQRERLVKQQEFRIEEIKTEIADTETVASSDPPKTNS